DSEHDHHDHPRLQLRAVRMTTPQDQLAVRTTTADLAAFCDEIRSRVDFALDVHDDELDVLLIVTCTPDNYFVKLAHRGAATAEILQAVLDSLIGMPKLAVREGDVVFEVELRLSP